MSAVLSTLYSFIQYYCQIKTVLFDIVQPLLITSLPWSVAIRVSIQKDIRIYLLIHAAHMTKIDQHLCLSDLYCVSCITMYTTSLTTYNTI